MTPRRPADPIRDRADGCGRVPFASKIVPIGGVFGLWRSLVAHLTGGQGVAGSNPVSPTEEPALTCGSLVGVGSSI